MTHAFSFDASACSGCKTCQEACKDKNRLSEGILWRRVVEVSGGEWQTSGSAWENSIFAYYISIACNHCNHPKCAGVCPTDAYTVRPDGIVLLDTSRCIGCGYCAWACPYGAPQYDTARGIMTKCDFCYDNIDAGLPPSCVAACPMRVLDYTAIENLWPSEGKRNLWQLPASEHPFPLPDYSRTEPNLAIKLHPAMNFPLEKTVSNREEIHPPQTAENDHGVVAFRELPLVAFTLLTQMAVGIAAFSLVLLSIPLALMLSIGILLVMGGAISLLHLGKKRNAWRAVTHLKKSWLSREILMLILFGIAWAVIAVMKVVWHTDLIPWPMALWGMGLIYCMSRVYLLRSVPGWNNWRTPVAFSLSAIVLGALGVRLEVPLPGLAFVAVFGMAAEMIMVLTVKPVTNTFTNWLRVALLGMGILGLLLASSYPQVVGGWLAIPVFIIALASEIIGRWQFYALRMPFPISPK